MQCFNKVAAQSSEMERKAGKERTHFIALKADRWCVCGHVCDDMKTEKLNAHHRDLCVSVLAFWI